MARLGVFRVADKGLDLQVLLDEAEKDFDLSTFRVDVGDGLGRQVRGGSEKHLNFIGFGSPVNHGTQKLGTLSGFGAGELNGFLTNQPQGGVDGPPAVGLGKGGAGDRATPGGGGW